MADKVLIFDTTLRDGEQSPGVALTADDKMEIARAAREAGRRHHRGRLPADLARRLRGGAGDRARGARTRRSPGWRTPIPDDVDACWDAVKVGAAAAHPRLPLELRHPHHAPAREGQGDGAGDGARRWSRAPRGYCEDVEFSPMDATRSDREYVYWMLEQCIEAGATTVNIPDTVGYTMPEEFAQFINDIYENVPNIHKARDLRALPQRPRPRRRELAGGRAGGRAPDRDVHQRHRRARRQRRARRSRDGDQDARATSSTSRRTSRRRSCTARAAWSRTSPA